MSPPLSITFRKAAQKDMPRVAELYMDCFAPWTAQPAIIPGYLSTMAAHPDWSFVVAEDSPGHIAGFVLVNCNYAKTHGTANIDVMAVDKEFRRHGLGKTLMHMSDLIAFNAGASDMTLQVVEHNEPAKKLYEGLGFNVVARRVKYYSDGTTALEMHKKLPALSANDAGHPAVQRKKRGSRF